MEISSRSMLVTQSIFLYEFIKWKDIYFFGTTLTLTKYCGQLGMLVIGSIHDKWTQYINKILFIKKSMCKKGNQLLVVTRKKKLTNDISSFFFFFLFTILLPFYKIGTLEVKKTEKRTVSFLQKRRSLGCEQKSDS